ncbi:hypothetical protein [Streptomyces sp. GS7]|uniref:hypothetical protein n=1 Tax=Streptomyces sp. GS7 TaxID=2692234 RepID=UPI003FA6E989
MAVRQRFVGLRQPWTSRHALLVIPVVLIAVITVVDIVVPAYVHLGPLLVIAPAITASFAGPRLTGAIGALAVEGAAHEATATRRMVAFVVRMVAFLVPGGESMILGRGGAVRWPCPLCNKTFDVSFVPLPSLRCREGRTDQGA